MSTYLLYDIEMYYYANTGLLTILVIVDYL